MRFSPWLFALKFISTNRSRATAPKPTPTTRPQLEPLEHRELLSTGVVPLPLGTATASLVDANDDLVLAGTTSDGDLATMAARYQSHGVIDSSFGDGGVSITDVDRRLDDQANAIALAADGKIVLAGEASEGSHPFDPKDAVLVRYNPDGSLDTSFGGNGKDAAGTVRIDLGGDERFHSVMVLPDGGIVAGGFSVDENFAGFTLAKLTPSGQLDPSFGSGGIVQTSLGITGGIEKVLLEDGKILAVGNVTVSLSPDPDQDFALARYHLDGSLDTTFGNGGTVLTNLSTTGNRTDVARDAIIDSNGNVVVVGNATRMMTDPGSVFAVARYDSAGNLDSTFDSDGVALLDIFGNAQGVAIQPDGKIILGGMGSYAGDVPKLARIHANGSLDTNFATAGVATLPIEAVSVDLQSTGKIVVTGLSSIARYNRDGTLDTTFGEPLPGITVTPTSDLETSEDGGTATFSIVLDTAPAPGTTVTIFLTSLDEGEGTVSVEEIVFNDQNWNVPVVVTITGQDDDIKDGDQDYGIQLTAQSTDPLYDMIDPDDVLVTNKDNEKGKGGPKK
jgi:uncharacterized delta-60 repeat protein